MKFGLRWIFLLTAVAAMVAMFFRPERVIGEHLIPIYPGFQFVSTEPYSEEFNWEGDLGLFHGRRWIYETDDELEEVKDFYEDAFPADAYSITVNVYDTDYLSIIVNFESTANDNEGEAFRLSMIGRKVTIDEFTTYSPRMKWPDRD